MSLMDEVLQGDAFFLDEGVVKVFVVAAKRAKVTGVNSVKFKMWPHFEPKYEKHWLRVRALFMPVPTPDNADHWSSFNAGWFINRAYDDWYMLTVDVTAALADPKLTVALYELPYTNKDSGHRIRFDTKRMAPSDITRFSVFLDKALSVTS